MLWKLEAPEEIVSRPLPMEGRLKVAVPEAGDLALVREGVAEDTRLPPLIEAIHVTCEADPDSTPEKSGFRKLA